MLRYQIDETPKILDITGEVLNPGSNKSAGARLDIHARGFWEKCTSSFFDVRVCHPNADKYIHHSPKQKYTRCTNKRRNASTQPESWKSKKELYSASFHHNWRNGRRVPQIPQKTGGTSGYDERRILTKKYELIRVKIFSLIRSALVCLRGSI